MAVAPGTLTQMVTEIRSRIPFWGVCTTRGEEMAVTALQFEDSDLVAGAVVFVRLTMKQTGDPTETRLNVNCTGAKPVKVLENGVLRDITSSGYLEANKTYMFVYDGNNWIKTTSVDTRAECFSITLTNPTFPVTVSHSRITENTRVLNGAVFDMEDLAWETSAGEVTLTSATSRYVGTLTLILANDIDVTESAGLT